MAWGRGGVKEVKKGVKQRDSELQTEKQGDRGVAKETGHDALSKKVWKTAGGHSHTVPATSLCCSVKLRFMACLKMEF